ncbi:MAG: sigma-70 family RNA polymerase sigma factor [Tannerella sp.]|nr:sigma-70 family RNA polymerase sigma factor [Tannerella sp.]
MNIDDDKILLIALRERNERAFNMIFRKYHKDIYHFVNQICNSPKDAEELTQDIFVKLWENSNVIPIVSLKGYLYALAKGMAIDWTRRSVNQAIFEMLTDEQALCPDESEIEEKKSFENKLSTIHHLAQSMPERRLEVFRMKWVENLPRKEIAQRMGITVTTVDIHLKKALDYLRAAVAKLPGESLGVLLLGIFLT